MAAHAMHQQPTTTTNWYRFVSKCQTWTLATDCRSVIITHENRLQINFCESKEKWHPRGQKKNYSNDYERWWYIDRRYSTTLRRIERLLSLSPIRYWNSSLCGFILFLFRVRHRALFICVWFRDSYFCLRCFQNWKGYEKYWTITDSSA